MHNIICNGSVYGLQQAMLATPLLAKKCFSTGGGGEGSGGGATRSKLDFTNIFERCLNISNEGDGKGTEIDRHVDLQMDR